MSGIPVRKAPALSQPAATTDATPLAPALAVTAAFARGGAAMSGRYPHKPDAGLTEADYGATLEEISRELSVSKERVRQIESQALSKARKILEKWGFTLQDLVLDGDRPTEVSQPEESQS